MGREARVAGTVAGHTEPLHALLESRELILRGATLRRRYALADLSQLRVEADALCWQAKGEAVALHLGAAEAAKWLERLHKPPPTLAAKLGIGPAQPAAVFGPAQDDAELAAALAGARTDQPAEASVLLAVVFSMAELQQALRLHADMPCPGLWVVHAKSGQAGLLGDGAIRETLRARGYRDHKSCAVSARLTATRYRRA